ncbi:SdpI family protein [Clostridium botulinum]|uniref:SdpI family protein n=1 Tax=Clostridium botulinum TaxID=1491 RepID=UPI001C9A3C7B|nr:SdpI family protein [Clostridium botulinum]MBY6767228.1 SdpI family protein [Clostridium botulinum]
MGFKIFTIVSNLIIPVIMLFFGVRFRKHEPKNINGIYGYRTSMSMKNKDTWEFAHQYCGRLWIKLGLIMLTISIIVSVLVFAYVDEAQGIIDAILVTIQTIVLIVSIFSVEKALKNNFDGNGNRRN